MKGKLRKKLILCLSVGALATGAALGVTATASAETLSKFSSPVLASSVYTQTVPDETEFTIAYSGTSWEQGVETTFKLYTSDDKTQEAGVVEGIVSETNAEKFGALKFMLNAAPERDTAYYLTATQDGYVESDTRVVNVQIANIVDAMTFSYGENTDISYVEFYQDQLTYDVVLPAGTAKDANVAVALDVFDGETAVYGGDTKLTDGKATVTASVTSETYGKTYSYTVNFTTMDLKGSGTLEDPWEISTASELMQLAACHNSGGAAPMDAEDYGAGNHYGYYFELTNDIDMRGYDWEPIGHSGNSYFAGNFNGNGYTISNMTSDGLYNRALNSNDEYIDYQHFNAVGLFGWAAFGTIENVIVENANFTAIGDNEQGYAGGLTAVAFGCTVTDCTVYNSTITSGRLPNVNTNAAGGAAGFGVDATFERCAMVGNTVTSASYGGGFIGSLDGDYAYFNDCYVAKSKVIGNSPSLQINTQNGGFIGESQFGTAYLTNCFVYDCIVEAAAENKSNASCGLLIGNYAWNDYVLENCYYYSKTGENRAPSYKVKKSGGFWQVQPANTTYITTALPDTEPLTAADVLSRVSDEKVWEFSVDGGNTWYATTLKTAVEKTAEEFKDGTVVSLLNANAETFASSELHEFPVLAGVREFSVSLSDSGIVSVGKIASDEKSSTYEILYIPAGEVTLHSYIFTVENGEDGAAAVQPKLRINETSNEWEVSYDNGETWTSLGVKATGEKGDKGDKGDQGDKGETGASAVQPKLRINETSNEWEVSYDNGETWTSLGVKATGEKGDKGETGEVGQTGATGATGAAGKDGLDGKDGSDGKNGLSITATALGGVSLASNIGLLAWIFLKRKKSL